MVRGRNFTVKQRVLYLVEVSYFLNARRNSYLNCGLHIILRLKDVACGILMEMNIAILAIWVLVLVHWDIVMMMWMLQFSKQLRMEQ